MSSSNWTDDELLNELRAALEESSVDEAVIRAAQAAFTWRTVDTDLELLSLDLGQDVATADLTRGAGTGSPRTVTFQGDRLTIVIEIDDEGIIGQVTPPQPGSVTLVTTDGPQATTQADEVGYFVLAACPSGPIRLDCRLGPDHFITAWTSV